MNALEWPAERVARLMILWVNPDLSQRAIGRELGVSAGAVGAKARRMRLGPKAMLRAAKPVPPTHEDEAALRRGLGEGPLPAYHPITWGVLRPRALEP